MVTLQITHNDGRGIKDAVALLQMHGYEVKYKEALESFCIQEAEYRLAEVSLDSEQQELYASLEEDERKEIIETVGEKLLEDNDIFDYDYMDDLICETFNNYMEERNIK